MMSENLFPSVPAARFTSDGSHIPKLCAPPLRRWGAKLLRITGMIIQARLVLEDILSQSVKAANLIRNPLWSSSREGRERDKERRQKNEMQIRFSLRFKLTRRNRGPKTRRVSEGAYLQRLDKIYASSTRCHFPLDIRDSQIIPLELKKGIPVSFKYLNLQRSPLGFLTGQSPIVGAYFHFLCARNKK